MKGALEAIQRFQQALQKMSLPQLCIRMVLKAFGERVKARKYAGESALRQAQDTRATSSSPSVRSKKHQFFTFDAALARRSEGDSRFYALLRFSRGVAGFERGVGTPLPFF